MRLHIMSHHIIYTVSTWRLIATKHRKAKGSK